MDGECDGTRGKCCTCDGNAAENDAKRQRERVQKDQKVKKMDKNRMQRFGGWLERENAM